jgi:tetratricopeptide (TPR) repeat protein
VNRGRRIAALACTVCAVALLPASWPESAFGQRVVGSGGQPPVRGGTIVGPDHVIESLERRVFFPEPHEDAFVVARAVQAEAARRAQLAAPGYSRLYRLAAAAWSRAGDTRAAARMAEAATKAPETVLDGADAWRMLGVIRAGDNEWERAAQAFQASLDRLEAGDYRGGSIRFPSLIGHAGALRALGQFDEAIRVQERFLARFAPSLKAREVRHLYRALAQDHASVGNGLKADAFAARLEREFPDWSDSPLGRVAFQIEIAARGDRTSARADRAYIDRLAALLDADELRGQPESLLVVDELIKALEAQGRDEEAHRRRLEVLESVWEMTDAGDGLRSPSDGRERLTAGLLRSVLGRLFAERQSGEHPLSDDQLVDLCSLLIDFYPESSMAAQASELLHMGEAGDK